MHRSVMEAEMDILWQRYGMEYKIVGSAVHPSEMSLLVEPVVNHRFKKRLPPASVSDEETEETRRASDDVTSLAEFDCSLFDQPSASAPSSCHQGSVVSPSVAGDVEVQGEVSAGSSTVTPDTIYECFASAPKSR